MVRHIVSNQWRELTSPGTCHTTLEAQLTRIQYEVRELLCDSAVSEMVSIPYDDIITTAKSVRRICLEALHAQSERFSTPASMLYLPPPRFKIQYCAFADYGKTSSHRKEVTSRRRSYDRATATTIERSALTAIHAFQSQHTPDFLMHAASFSHHMSSPSLEAEP
jgi:hypothetical protein